MVFGGPDCVVCADFEDFFFEVVAVLSAPKPTVARTAPVARAESIAATSARVI